MMHLLCAAVQIITESFPISSSGHLMLLLRFMRRWGYAVSPVLIAYDELTALPTLVVLLTVCWHSIVHGIYKVVESPLWGMRIMGCAALATVPTVLMYGMVYSGFLKRVMPLEVGFGATALLLWLTYYAVTDGALVVSWRHMLIIGVAQALAFLVPGLSRMATTYAVACWLGYASPDALSLSLFLEIPLLLGACVKGILFHTAVWRAWHTAWTAYIVVLIAMYLAMLGLRCMYMLAYHNHVWYVAYYLMIPLIGSIILRCW